MAFGTGGMMLNMVKTVGRVSIQCLLLLTRCDEAILIS